MSTSPVNKQTTVYALETQELSSPFKVIFPQKITEQMQFILFQQESNIFHHQSLSNVNDQNKQTYLLSQLRKTLPQNKNSDFETRLSDSHILELNTEKPEATPPPTNPITPLSPHPDDELTPSDERISFPDLSFLDTFDQSSKTTQCAKQAFSIE